MVPRDSKIQDSQYQIKEFKSLVKSLEHEIKIKEKRIKSIETLFMVH